MLFFVQALHIKKCYVILFFAGIHTMLFGIVGEYLGRIFKESKGRPLYLVDEYNGKSIKFQIWNFLCG